MDEVRRTQNPWTSKALMSILHVALVLGAAVLAGVAYHEWAGGSREAGFTTACTVLIILDTLFNLRRSKR
jgi:hypothetical protein